MLAWILDNRGRSLCYLVIASAFFITVGWAADHGAIGAAGPSHPLATCTRTLC